MQEKAKPQSDAASTQKKQVSPKATGDNANGSASGRWTAVHRARLPHKAGLPLSSGGCGDNVSR
jgi:hypothetical protein